jgi:uncharacterized linocin/CFP29 family protein
MDEKTQDFLNHNENPLSAGETERLSDAVIGVARRKLVGRRFIEIYGPLGPGVQAIPYDEFSGTTPGAVDIVGEQETATVFTDQRRFRVIPIIYKDFLLHWRDILAARNGPMPLDVSAAAGAASFVAEKEDELVFYGDARLGYEGLLNAAGRSIVTGGPWDQAGVGLQNVISAMERLFTNGHYGPYAMVASPRVYALLHRVSERTGVLEIDNLRQLIEGGVYRSNVLKGDVAVVVSTGSENFDLAVALDMSVAYLGAERMNHPFRVLECLCLRIKHPDAICTIE